MGIRHFLGRRIARVAAVVAVTIAGGVLWAPAPAHALASITCPQALLSFQWTAGDSIGTPHPISMSASQCTTGFRTSALAYGSGTITDTIGTSVFTNNNFVFHYHVDLTITVPDLALGPVSVSRSFDVEAPYLTAFCFCASVPSTILHYANSGPILTGLLPAGWWTERATFSYPTGSSLVEASLAL